MWGPGLCGAGMWGFWWIFPLVGVLVCFTLIVMAFRFLSTGRGLSCMGRTGGNRERPDRGDAARNQHPPRGDQTAQNLWMTAARRASHDRVGPRPRGRHVGHGMGLAFLHVVVVALIGQVAFLALRPRDLVGDRGRTSTAAELALGADAAPQRPTMRSTMTQSFHTPSSCPCS